MSLFVPFWAKFGFWNSFIALSKTNVSNPWTVYYRDYFDVVSGQAVLEVLLGKGSLVQK